MMSSLDKAKIGSECIIVKVSGEKPIKRRLMDMGLIPGTRVFVKRLAPLGDPMEIMVRGTELTLRKADALNIMIEVIAEG
ncbi:MAG: FeoA family protein [Candidatus Izemoplasmatales bacterium]|nr:FeoA family protein [Candidatus Izemoplasmatales bacterium]